MPYTTDGHWFGPGEPTQPGPRLVARCGGPGLCPRCALEAAEVETQAEVAEVSAPASVPAAVDFADVTAALQSLGIPTDDLLRAVLTPGQLEVTYVRRDEQGRKFTVGQDLATITAMVRVTHTQALLVLDLSTQEA